MRASEIVSSLRTRRTSRFVFSSLAFYGRGARRELPGSWFIAALSALGLEEMAVRQTLYRMERDGELTARKEGRSKFYAPSPAAVAIIDAGSAKMRPPREKAWDGRWTIVQLQPDGVGRVHRERLRDLLAVEGFAPLGGHSYLHPRDRSARVLAAAEQSGFAAHLHVFRGPRLGGAQSDAAFVRTLWNLDALAPRYERFLARFAPLARRQWRDAREAAGVRFALVFDYLEVAWDDPELPAQLLPPRWPGARARRLVAELYDRLAPPSRAYGEQVLQAIGSSTARERATR
jgi:phenylacetic acid degradation operon negative regulatory protein